MEKFYLVLSLPEGANRPVVHQYHIVDFDKAERVAKTAAVDTRKEVYILTSSHMVLAPVPEATVTPIA